MDPIKSALSKEWSALLEEKPSKYLMAKLYYQLIGVPLNQLGSDGAPPAYFEKLVPGRDLF